MRTSQYLLATEKETPKDAELASHQLMLRAGMIRKLASGVYTWLPTGLRVLNKVSQIVREEMNASGAAEVTMPCIIPAELWQQTGRWEQFGSELLKIQDRHGRDFCFGPTHEEVITYMASAELRSYKQLPINLYQIQTKFRDEIRPRFGVMRAREFLMKDAYSFHLDKASLAETYQVMHDTYHRIFKRLGLTVQVVDADAGAIGGSVTQEFHVLAASGEDDIFYSNQSDYAANVEKATCLAPQTERPGATQTMRLFDTPGQRTIQDLADNYNIPAEQSAKTMIGQDAEGTLFAFILRGNHNLNLTKAAQLEMIQGELELASDEVIKNTFKASPGSLGPVNCPIPVIVDRDAATLADFVCGANQDGKHYKGVNWERDIPEFTVGDIRDVMVGDHSPDGKGTLQHAKGIEVGHIFQLGDKYSQRLGATVLDENGKAVHPQMGCYGLGISRVIAAAIEQNHDENGIIWPGEMAPFDVAIIPMKYHQSERVQQTADQLYKDLKAKGFEVLLDDRQERPGAMFADMDLIGIPHRIVVGERGLANDQVEYKARASSEKQDVALREAMSLVR